MQIQQLLEQITYYSRTVPDTFMHELDRQTPAREAAVVVPIVEYRNHATILLTKRTAHLSAHAGEICFPGGMREPEDATLLDTALRECREELGISEAALDVLGEGRGRVTGTGFHITPFFAHIRAPLQLAPDRFEVEEVLELPLHVVLRRASYQKLTTTHNNHRRSYDMLSHDGHCIWGATAGILRDLCRLLDGEFHPPSPLPEEIRC